MYICRTHGEPLVRNEKSALVECPERFVCGTYVTDEFMYRGSDGVASYREMRSRDELLHQLITVVPDTDPLDPFSSEIMFLILHGTPEEQAVAWNESIRRFLDDYIWHGEPHDFD